MLHLVSLVIFLLFLHHCVQVRDCVHAVNDVCILLLNVIPANFHCGTLLCEGKGRSHSNFTHISTHCQVPSSPPAIEKSRGRMANF